MKNKYLYDVGIGISGLLNERLNGDREDKYIPIRMVEDEETNIIKVISPYITVNIFKNTVEPTTKIVVNYNINVPNCGINISNEVLFYEYEYQNKIEEIIDEIERTWQQDVYSLIIDILDDVLLEEWTINHIDYHDSGLTTFSYSLSNHINFRIETFTLSGEKQKQKIRELLQVCEDSVNNIEIRDYEPLSVEGSYDISLKTVSLTKEDDFSWINNVSELKTKPMYVNRIDDGKLGVLIKSNSGFWMFEEVRGLNQRTPSHDGGFYLSELHDIKQTIFDKYVMMYDVNEKEQELMSDITNKLGDSVEVMMRDNLMNIEYTMSNGHKMMIGINPSSLLDSSAIARDVSNVINNIEETIKINTETE